MKFKLLLTSLISAIVFSASAGEYCAKGSDKCPIDSCPQGGGEISFGYETDYIFYGVRLARDSVWADVNYTFDCLPIPITVGAWHLTSLDSTGGGPAAFGDETDLYATAKLKGFLGFCATAGVIHRLYPTTRLPNGGRVGDSNTEFWLKIERELFCGVNAAYRRAYNYNLPSAFAGFTTANNTDEGAWIHELILSKSICLTECISLDLTGGVLYSDNFWPADGTANDRDRSSGWNNYYLRAALPMKLNCCATVTPYIGYNGSPDSWIADGVNANIPGGNANDIFHGGVSVSVKF